MPSLIEDGFSKGELGIALSAISIAYGFSKFIMGTISDRSNARIFLTLGLILTAIVNLLLGFVPFFTSSITIMFVLLFLNGWFQGMGGHLQDVFLSIGIVSVNVVVRLQYGM